MSFFGFGDCKADVCKAFSTADRANDTVSLLMDDKENVAPLTMKEQSEEKAAAEEIERAAQERERAEADARRELQKAEEQRWIDMQIEAERARAAAEEEKRRREEEEALRAQEEADEQRKAQETLDQMLREEKAKREREAQESAEKASVETAMLAEFLKINGYADVNSKRTKKFRSKFPLHTAAKRVDAHMVSLLLQAGADKTKKNSAGLTPLEYSKKLNVRNSHDEILLILAQ